MTAFFVTNFFRVSYAIIATNVAVQKRKTTFIITTITNGDGASAAVASSTFLMSYVRAPCFFKQK